MRRVLVLVSIVALVVLIFTLNRPLVEKTVIVAGVSNPGRILIYTWNGYGFTRNQIDTGYKLVWTVRVGDIYNNGKSEIIAGVGNSFYGPPFGCSVVAYSIESGQVTKIVIDNVGDLRCKDLTIGDVYNDGKNAIVLGTHGEGLIRTYEWNGTGWMKDDVDRNFIGQVDEQLGTNHRVPLQNITYNTVVQTAVHMVKIGDVDNDGKNELVATISSPLEYAGQEITFTNVYKWNGTAWNRQIIHNGTGFEDRSVLIGDFVGDGKNQILVGAAPSKLFLMQDMSGKWTSNLVYRDPYDKNMKGLDFNNIYNTGNKILTLSTGVPNSLTYIMMWNGTGFVPSQIGNVSQVYSSYQVIGGLSYNALDVKIRDLYGDGKNEIITAGEADTGMPLQQVISSQNNFGWETTPYGFLVVYNKVGNTWHSTILDSYSVLGLDVGKLSD